jgi:hypothetical protein
MPKPDHSEQLAIAEVTIYSDDHHPPQSEEKGIGAIQIVKIKDGIRESLLGLPLMRLGENYSIEYPQPVKYSNGLIKKMSGTLRKNGGFLYLENASVVYDGSNEEKTIKLLVVALTEDMKINNLK